MYTAASTAGTSATDTVEVGGAGLLYIAATDIPDAKASGDGGDGGGVSIVRRVTLPGAFAVTAEGGRVVCTAAAPCNDFETPALRKGENALFWLS